MDVNLPDDKVDYVWSRNVEPDKSKGDFYCKVCESHMNSQEIWDLHISGKRHTKNSKKMPGDRPTKMSRAYTKEDAEARLMRKLSEIDEPVVGLSFMRELQRGEVSNLYTCFLCKASCSNDTVIKHITSTSHRLKYLQETDLAGFELIASMTDNKRVKDSIVADKVAEWQAKEGMGKIEVQIEDLPPVLNGITQGVKRSCPFPVPGVNMGLDDPTFDISHTVPLGVHSHINSKDINSYPIDTKLRILEELSSKTITSDAEASAVEFAIDRLDECLVQYQSQNLYNDDRPEFVPQEPYGRNDPGMNSAPFQPTPSEDGFVWLPMIIQEKNQRFHFPP